MKLGKDAREKNISFSISMPISLYNEIDKEKPNIPRSTFMCRLIKYGLKEWRG